MQRIENPVKILVRRLARIRFVRTAMAENADLSAFKARPDFRVIAGVSAIAFSYVIGWPLISLLGGAAVHYRNAAIAVVGGPAVYGLSHLVFLLGMYLAGARYSHIFLKWATRVAVQRLMLRYGLPLPAPALPDIAVVAGHNEAGRQQGSGNAPPVSRRG
jgi:hypothetical protein